MPVFPSPRSVASSLKTTMQNMVGSFYAPIQGILLVIGALWSIAVLSGAPVESSLTLPIFLLMNGILAVVPMIQQWRAQKGIDPYLFDKRVSRNPLNLLWHYFNCYDYAFDLQRIKHYPKLWRALVATLTFAALLTSVAAGIALMDFFLVVSEPVSLVMAGFALVGTVMAAGVFALTEASARFLEPPEMPQVKKSLRLLVADATSSEEISPITKLMGALDSFSGQRLSCDFSQSETSSWTDHVIKNLADTTQVVVYQPQEILEDQENALNNIIAQLLDRGISVMRVAAGPKIQEVSLPGSESKNVSFLHSLKTIYWQSPKGPVNFLQNHANEVLARLAQWMNKSQQQYLVVEEFNTTGSVIYKPLALLKNLEAAEQHKETLDSAKQLHIRSTSSLKWNKAVCKSSDKKQRAVPHGKDWTLDTLKQEGQWFSFTKQATTTENLSLYTPDSDISLNALPGQAVVTPST